MDDNETDGRSSGQTKWQQRLITAKMQKQQQQPGLKPDTQAETDTKGGRAAEKETEPKLLPKEKPIKIR